MTAAIDVSTNGVTLRPAAPDREALGARDAASCSTKDPTLAVPAAFAAGYTAVADKLGWDADAARRDRSRVRRRAGAARRVPARAHQAVLRRRRGRREGRGRAALDHGESRGVQGLQPLRRGLPRRRARDRAGRTSPCSQQLRRNWALWEKLPDTDDRFVNVSDVDEGIGVLSSLLLKKRHYRSMVGGDGACMGCGEKTAVHLIVSAIHASMQPRVARHVAQARRAHRGARRAGARAARLRAPTSTPPRRRRDAVAVPVDAAKRDELAALSTTRCTSCSDLRWRYVEGPERQRPRAARHGEQHRLLVGVGQHVSVQPVSVPVGEPPVPGLAVDRHRPVRGAHAEDGRRLRRGAPRRAAARRARTTPAMHEPALRALDWQQFTDDEFALCPPIVAMGGDGAMLDIGFQNLSRLLASGKPIRVVVLDTQVYSNTGGQACTTGFTGQVADMAAYGKAQHGKTEMRKELGADRHRASRRLRAPVVAGLGVAPHRRRAEGTAQAPPGGVQHLHAVPGGARAGRRLVAAGGAAGAREPRLPVPHVRSGRRHVLRRLPVARRQSVAGRPTGRRTTSSTSTTTGAEQTHGAAADDRRLGGHRGALQAALHAKCRRTRGPTTMIPFHEFVAAARADDREGRHAVHPRGGQGPQAAPAGACRRRWSRLAEERLQFWSQLQAAGRASRSRRSVRDAVADALEAEFEQRLAAAARRVRGEDRRAARRATRRRSRAGWPRG